MLGKGAYGRAVSRYRGRHARRHGASVQGQLANWTNSLVTRAQAERDMALTADRALDLYTNDAMAHGVLETLLVEAVGIGLTPQPTPGSDWLGKTPEWEDEFRTAALRIWEAWGLDCRNFCDAGGRLDYYGLQGLAFFNWKLFGIGVAQVIAKKRPGAPLSLCLLNIDPFRLVTPNDAKGADIYDGVEVDSDGLPMAVWVRKPGAAIRMSPPGSACTRIDVYDKETGLPRVLLVCDVRNVAEYRQDSVLGSMISEIRNSNDLAEAVVVGAMVRNLFTLFVQDFGQGAVSQDTPLEQRVLEMEKGTVLKGHKNEKPHFFSHQAAPTGYSELFGGIVERLGMATGRGAENVLRKFQASYSAARANMEKAEQFNQVDHRTMVNRFIQPTWCWMLYEAMLRDLVPISRAEFEANMYAVTRAGHMAQPMRHIDREKTAKATVLELAENYRTLAEVCAERGTDWRETMKQRAKELAFRRKLEERYGVNLSLETAPASTTTETSDKDENDEQSD